jgi:hypothetical protein
LRETNLSMSFKTRERKRRAKFQAEVAASAAKAKHSDNTAVKYYLRHVKHDCRCVACGRYLKRNDEMVYRHSGAVKLCIQCADDDPLVVYEASARWEARKRTEIEVRARKAAKKAW